MRIYIIIAILLTAISIPAYADTLMLKNGDRISGSVLSAKDSDVIEFHTSFGQDISLPKELVTEVVYSAKPEISKKDSSTAKENIKAAEVKKQEVKLSDAKWSGRVNLGANLQRGNSKKNNLNTDAMLKTKWHDKHRLIVKADYNREVDNSIVTEDNRSIEGSYDTFYRRKWFFNSSLGFEQDRISRLNLRSKAAIGIGRQLYERDDLNLKFVAGPSYFRDDYKSGNSDDSIGVQWVTDYDQKLFDGAIQLFHDDKLRMPVKNSRDFLFYSKTGVRVPIVKGIVATLQADIDWDNMPEPGVAKHDAKYSLKLGYEW